MITRPALLSLICTLAGPAGAETVAEQAARASADLSASVAALETAESGKNRVAALTTTIRAYEDGLAALREALRQATLREAELTLRFEVERDRIAALTGVLAQMEAEPGPLLLLHPEGPLGTVRSGMMLADVTPALQAEAERLKAELAELRSLQAMQVSAGVTLSRGLAAAQEARTALSKAMSDRTDLPRRFTEDPETLKNLLASADTLDAFAAGLAPSDIATEDFTAARGHLPLPVAGTLLHAMNEADATGTRRPGLTLATRPHALVLSPWPATIRYRGPLLDYGNVMILEPGGGYLLVLAGMDILYGEVGEVVAAGAPLGLMGGTETASDDLFASVEDGGGARETETLYLELRQGATPVDPAEWFAIRKE